VSAAAEAVPTLVRWAVMVALREHPQSEPRKPYVRRKKKAKVSNG
jgi:hypothetical protein